jgi:uncharacterized membrane protein YqiK
MNIVKAITDQRNAALVPQVQDAFEQYRQLHERHSAFHTSLPSDLAALDADLRKFCAAIPAMEKEAEASAEASAYFYAGLVQMAPMSARAVEGIAAEIARLKAKAEAEARAKAEAEVRAKAEAEARAKARAEAAEERAKAAAEAKKAAADAKVEKAKENVRSVFNVIGWIVGIGGIIAGIIITIIVSNYGSIIGHFFMGGIAGAICGGGVGLIIVGIGHIISDAIEK